MNTIHNICFLQSQPHFLVVNELIRHYLSSKSQSHEPILPHSSTIPLRHCSNVEVPYNWVVVKPVMKPPDPAAAANSDGSFDTSLADMPQDRIHDASSPFSVEPESGVLAASAEAEFMITYAPPEVRCIQYTGLTFTKSPNRKELGKGYKGLETVYVSSPILCCSSGKLWQIFKISRKWDLKWQHPNTNSAVHPRIMHMVCALLRLLGLNLCIVLQGDVALILHVQFSHAL